MAVWDGFPMPPRDEDDWHDPSDEEADEWRGGEPPDQGDSWKTDGWRYGDMTPEERMYREMLEDDGDEEGGP